jgi:pyruvate/2-oxoglutarate dehydrogenase complex dihydrolipoamide acyltransferase (E2) component
MKQQHADYQVVPYPKMRRLEALAYRSVQHKPMIHGLLEVDVTRARAFLREYKAITGESLSFTAFLIACLAKAWNGFKAIHWPWLLLLPAFQVMVWMTERSPKVWKKYRGTVGITAVGMFGKGAGWGIPLPSHALWITVGGIGEKPGVVDGHIAIREYLSLTLSFDHETIDGAPAARFTQRLKELIESGYGLGDSTVELEQAGAEGASKHKVDATRNALP